MEDAFSGKWFRGIILAGLLIVWGWSVFTSESVDLPYKFGLGAFATYHDNIIVGFPAVLVGLGLTVMGVAVHLASFWGQVESTAQFGKRTGKFIMWPGWISFLIGLGIPALNWFNENFHWNPGGGR